MVKKLALVLIVVAIAVPLIATHAQSSDVSGHIVVWGWTSAIRDTVEASGVVEAFNEAYPNVEVEIVYYPPTDLYTNLPLALTAGEGACDVCLVEDSHLSEFVQLGGLADMTDRVTPYLDITNAYRWPNAELDGRYYGMPWDSGPVVMYYRRDVLDMAGLASEPEAVSEMVSTWDGYLDMCRTIKEQTGLYCFAHNKANNYGRLYEMALWQQGLGYYDRETGEVTVNSPENVATLEMLGKFWEEDLVSDNLEWTDPWYAEFAALPEEDGAPVATLVEASWMDVFFKSWIAPGTEGLWGVAYMPAFTDGEVRASNDGGSAFVIPEQSENKDAAWAFVQFVVGTDASQIAMFRQSGFVPALETTYTDPVFEEADPFFADQQTKLIYVDVVHMIPAATVYGPNYNMMNGLVSTAIQTYATGQMSAQEALDLAAEEIAANLE